MSRTQIDPELLSAYLDGELAPDEMARVEALLATSSADRATVDRLRQLNVLLTAAYEAPHRAPLPAALQRSVAVSALRPRLRRRWTVAGLAMAASVTGLALFLGLRPTEPAPGGLAPGGVARGTALHALLESEPTGATAALDGQAATLLSSFFDGEGRPCREFEITDGGAGSLTQAVACRDDASWTVEFVVSGASAPADSRDAYIPASGADDAAFSAALDALGAGIVLGPAEEEDLIQRDWRIP